MMRAAFLRQAEAAGWRLERRTGSGHLQLRHVSGARAVVASSPSGSRAVANEMALLRRLVRRFTTVELEAEHDERA